MWWWAEKMCHSHENTRSWRVAAEVQKIVICQRMVALLFCFLPYLPFATAEAASLVAASRHTLKEWRTERRPLEQ